MKIITRPNDLQSKLEAIKKDGASQLHIITDFDRTLTKAFVGKDKSPSIIGQIRNSDYLGQTYVKKAHELFDKYYPIEIDPSLSLKEKIPAMDKWWREHFDLIIESKLNKQILAEIVSQKTIQFRQDALKILDFLHKHNIPIIIMSASLGDMIEDYLEQEGRLYSNIHVLANHFIFDEQGYVTGVKDPVVHCMNKHETDIADQSFFAQLRDRPNVILMGDSLSDLGMVEGFPCKNLIKIGFLNENVNERLEDYRDNFDVVLTDDAPMTYILDMLDNLL